MYPTTGYTPETKQLARVENLVAITGLELLAQAVDESNGDAWMMERILSGYAQWIINNPDGSPASNALRDAMEYVTGETPSWLAAAPRTADGIDMGDYVDGQRQSRFGTSL